MGVTIYMSSYVDLCRGIGRVRPLHRFLRDSSIFLALLALFFLVLQSELPNAIKFIWIFTVSLLSGYRSFRLVTQREGRALFSAFVTAQMVTALAFGMVTYLNQGSAYVAVVLAFAWYANQGFILHALDDSLTRRVFFEYGLFAVICIYLVALALLTRSLFQEPLAVCGESREGVSSLSLPPLGGAMNRPGFDGDSGCRDQATPMTACWSW